MVVDFIVNAYCMSVCVCVCVCVCHVDGEGLDAFITIQFPSFILTF